MGKKIVLISLGCDKNLVDSEIMMQLLQEEGHDFVDNPEDAHIIIINTCGFIESAKRESVNTILDLCRFKNDGSCDMLIVTGCLAQRYLHDLVDEIPEIDALIGTAEFRTVVKVIADFFGENCSTNSIDAFTSNLDTTGFVLQRHLTPPHTSFVKIAEGCSNFCSYCAIPSIRGPLISRTIDSIHREVSAKTRNGVKEIILVAQDLTQFGLDRGDPKGLVHLLQNLIDVETLSWLRLLYTYPSNITDDLIEIIAQSDVICNYLDIPMQHCSDDILRRMNRRDLKKDLVGLVQKLRTAIPGITLRSTFIVGFPGETEDHFNELLEFLQEIKLDRAGFFQYSQEDGTAAASFPEQVSKGVKEERFYRASDCQEKVAYTINRSFIGKQLHVLVEEGTENPVYPFIGRSYRDAPEVDGQVYLHGKNAQPGDIVSVTVSEADAYDLYGSIIYPEEESAE